MVQMCIYDYLGHQSDPIYQTISILEKGQGYDFKTLKVSLNHYGLYEISNEIIHEGFNDPEECYLRIQELIQ